MAGLPSLGLGAPASGLVGVSATGGRGGFPFSSEGSACSADDALLAPPPPPGHRGHGGEGRSLGMRSGPRETLGRTLS